MCHALSQPLVLTRDEVARHPDLSLFQKLLLLTDGSVTEMLSVYHGGQPIRARRLGQWLHEDAPPVALRPGSERAAALAPPPEPVAWLERRIVLEAGPPHDARPLVYATSAFRLDGLSPATRHGLLHTDTPIGALWQAERCEMHREIIDMRLHVDAEAAAPLGLPAGAPLAARQYRLWQGGRAVGWIQEQFALQAFRPGAVSAPTEPAPPALVIRSSTHDDLPGLWEVRYAVTENTLAPGRISDAQLRRAIEEEGRGWVAESRGRILGFCIGLHSGQVWALFVHPDAQGRGIGSALHAEMLAWYAPQGVARLWLSTGADTRARAFYEARGWLLAGPSGVDEVRLERPNVA